MGPESASRRRRLVPSSIPELDRFRAGLGLTCYAGIVARVIRRPPQSDCYVDAKTVIASIFALCLLALARPIEPQESALTAGEGRVLLDQGHAFLELSSPESEYVVGQPFWLVLRIGIEREFAETQLIQMFRTALDLPVQLQADWLGESAVLQALGDAPKPSSAALRFALLGNQATAEPLADRELAGAVYRVYEYKQRFQVSEAQELKLSPVELRYAFATEFEENFLSGRIPSNRIDALVRSAPLQLKIKEFPLDHPPIDFSGAVGAFQISARLGRPVPGAAQRIQWVLRIEGQGNLSELTPPSLLQWADFSVQGVLASEVQAQGAASSREFVYDLAPKGERPASIPAYNFTYFDVNTYGFETLSTEALPLPVLPAQSGDPLVVLPAQPLDSVAEDTGPGIRVLPWLLYLGLPVGFLLWLLLRHKTLQGTPTAAASGSEGASLATQRSNALRSFESELAPGNQELLAAYSNYLGACLETRAAELPAKGLSLRLQREGIPAALAERAEAALDSLLGAQYGRGECGQEGQAAAAIVGELAQHWP